MCRVEISLRSSVSITVKICSGTVKRVIKSGVDLLHRHTKKSGATIIAGVREISVKDRRVLSL